MGVGVGGGRAFKYYRQYYEHCADIQVSVICIAQNDGKKRNGPTLIILR